MWGELAAWKISAQLSDQLVPLEAKLAAASQVHDEARHFYVMHDYLEALGQKPAKLEFWAGRVLKKTLSTDNLLKKLIGMQLTVETIALVAFQRVRELEIEPVLSGLMPYYERDEARHIGLGVQLVPQLMSELSLPGAVDLAVFQLDVLTAALFSVKAIERDPLGPRGRPAKPAGQRVPQASGHRRANPGRVPELAEGPAGEARLRGGVRADVPRRGGRRERSNAGSNEARHGDCPAPPPERLRAVGPARPAKERAQRSDDCAASPRLNRRAFIAVSPLPGPRAKPHPPPPLRWRRGEESESSEIQAPPLRQRRGGGGGDVLLGVQAPSFSCFAWYSRSLRK